MKTAHDGDAIEHEGKTFHFEMLENGMLRTYDYECKWPLLFKKNENGEWKPENLNAMAVAYKGIALKLNGRKTKLMPHPTAFRMRPSEACWGGEVSEQEWMDMNKGE